MDSIFRRSANSNIPPTLFPRPFSPARPPPRLPHPTRGALDRNPGADLDIARGYEVYLKSLPTVARRIARDSILNRSAEPGTEELQWLLGISSSVTRESDQAFANVIEAKPHHLPTLLSRACRRIASKALDEAEEDLLVASRTHPWSASPWVLQGRIHTLRREYSRALANFEKAFQIAPEDPFITRSEQTAYLLEAIRAHGTDYAPRVVFTSMNFTSPPVVLDSMS